MSTSRDHSSRTFCLVPVLTSLLVACAPDTDLLGESAGGGGGDPADDPAATAGATLLDPTPGAGAVPPNLAAVVVRFPAGSAPAGATPDGPLSDGEPLEGTLPEGTLVVSSGGRSVGAAAPVAVPCPAAAPGTCFRAALEEPLIPAATHLVSLADGLVDVSGRALGGGPVGQFVTGGMSDVTPPVIASFTVDPSGPCVLVTFQTDEPVAGTLVVRAAEGRDRNVPAGAGATQFSVAASLAELSGGSDVLLFARAVDRAGNVAETAAVSMTVPLGLMSLAITEVQANALGPEPAQEYVELRNLGGVDLDVAGLLLEDEKGADILPAAVIAAGAYALIVPAGFAASGTTDVPPRPGTMLIRVDARLGADGLANGGEVVRLRNPGGTVLSSYGGVVDVSAAKWAGKGVHRLPEEACDQAASWTRLPLAATPGAAGP